MVVSAALFPGSVAGLTFCSETVAPVTFCGSHTVESYAVTTGLNCNCIGMDKLGHGTFQVTTHRQLISGSLP